MLGAYDVDTPRHQDFIDVTIRSEIMNSVQGAPAMMQHRASKLIPGIQGPLCSIHGRSSLAPFGLLRFESVHM